MIELPDSTISIYLDVDGWADDFDDDSYYPGAKWLELRANLSNGKSTCIWESTTYDNDDLGSIVLMRKELIDVFKELNLNTGDIEDFDYDCCYDWEFKHIY